MVLKMAGRLVYKNVKSPQEKKKLIKGEVNQQGGHLKAQFKLLPGIIILDMRLHLTHIRAMFLACPQISAMGSGALRSISKFSTLSRDFSASLTIPELFPKSRAHSAPAFPLQDFTGGRHLVLLACQSG